MKKRVKKIRKKDFHMAIAAFIFGVLSLLIPYFAYMSILIAIYAIAKIDNHKEFKGKEYAYSGIILSILSIIFYAFKILV
nr:hypothetical protein [Nanoarchaeum sp.]